MSSLLLVGNPKRRRATRRKAPSAAQLRARAKFAAMARSRSKTARSNPVRRKRRAAPVAKARTSRRVRRNPIGGLNMRTITAQLKSAGIGALGAVGVDAAFGFVKSYLPESVQSPADASGQPNYLYFAAKGALAIGGGLLLKKAIGMNKAAAVVEGSLTVTLHDAMVAFASMNIPSIALGNMPGGRILPPLPASQSLHSVGGMGMQVSNARRSMLVNQNMRGVNSYVSASSREGNRR